eukprot:356542-Chlamydomonas_euryale.AAC.5
MVKLLQNGLAAAAPLDHELYFQQPVIQRTVHDAADRRRCKSVPFCERGEGKMRLSHFLRGVQMCYMPGSSSKKCPMWEDCSWAYGCCKSLCRPEVWTLPWSKRMLGRP